MFALTHGAWPRVGRDGTDLDALEAAVAAGRADGAALARAVEARVGEVVRTQVDAGLDVVTDGQVRWPDLGEAVLAWLDSERAGAGPPVAGPLVDAWRAAAGLTDRPVAQAVPGPYSLGWRAHGDPAGRPARTLELAADLGRTLHALAEAGCAIVLVEEPRAVDIGVDRAERELFAEAQRRLLGEAPDLHATLVIAGGSAAGAGPGTILGAPYRSFLFDLIAGPDNWYLARATPGDRGVVCGAHRVADPPPGDQAPLLAWAAAYAASTAGRGVARVGLANASSMRGLRPETAALLAGELARAARLAAMDPAEAVAAGLDPRTFGGGQAARRGRA
jgi:hypothetical protein